MRYQVAGGADGRWTITLEDGTAFEMRAPDGLHHADIEAEIAQRQRQALAERVARLEQAADRDAAQVRLLDHLARLEQRVAALEQR